MVCVVATSWTNNGPKYLIAVIWLGINATLMWYTYNQYKYSPQFFYLHQILGAGLCWSRGTASLINLNLGVLLLPMCRTIIAALRGTGQKVPMRKFRTLMDHSRSFHEFCCCILVVASVVHFFAHCFNAENYSNHYNVRFKTLNAAQYPKQNPLFILLTSVPGVTGILLLVILSMIVSSAAYAIRSTCYDVFWYMHRLTFVFYMLVFVHALRGILKRQTNTDRHTPGCVYINSTEPWPETRAEPELSYRHWSCTEDPVFDTVGSSTWLWTIVPLCLYIGDITYRSINRHRHAAITTSVSHREDHILELHVRKEGFKCRPGQYVLLQVPKIASFEWHPYTVSKVPDSRNTGEFSLHIKATGDWSVRLRDHLLEEQKSPVDSDLLLGKNVVHSLYIDGPFGSPMEDVLRYKVCVCIAGGIGITPFVALLNSIRTEDHWKLNRLYLIWTLKDLRHYMCFADIICDTHNQFWTMNRPDAFNVQLNLTEAASPIQPNSLEKHKVLQKRIFFGRPNWSSVMCKISSSFPSQKVGVFCCGPNSLIAEVNSQCLKSNNGGTKFHFYQESF